MILEKKVEARPEQPYVAIRSRVPMSELPRVIPRGIGEVFGWLGGRGVEPAGAPFIRYNTIDMPRELDVEVGVPVGSPVAGDGRIVAGTLPAGRYGTLLYRGAYSGLMDANRELLEWGEGQGLMWDQSRSPQGDVFRARLEAYLTNPAEEPDESKHETVVAIKLKK
jgi:effector-binding domain-containing protein